MARLPECSHNPDFENMLLLKEMVALLNESIFWEENIASAAFQHCHRSHLHVKITIHIITGV